LEKLLKQLKDYRPNSYTRRRLFLDAKFHVGIAEMAGNQIITDLLIFIFQRIYLRYKMERLPFKRMDEADREHTMILDAIKRKDEKLALRRLDDHFKKVKFNLMLTIKDEF
ncbi:MAG: FCD domain-containing protein, partial [Candidatus Jordarchaeaceae archaeon]